ncbi:MAG: hypothetical protein R3A45_12660 [Bdellovibrionota bacterium]
MIRRRKKYIDPHQQTRLAFEIVLLVLIFPVLFYILTISDLWSKVFFGSRAEVMQELFLSQLLLLKQAWHVILVILVFIVFLSILFTHKIFGPIYRFKQILQAKLDGENEVYFSLRRGDYMQDFAALVQKVALCKIDVPQDIQLRSNGDVFEMQDEGEMVEKSEQVLEE